MAYTNDDIRCAVVMARFAIESAREACVDAPPASQEGVDAACIWEDAHNCRSFAEYDMTNMSDTTVFDVVPFAPQHNVSAIRRGNDVIIHDDAHGTLFTVHNVHASVDVSIILYAYNTTSLVNMLQRHDITAQRYT